MTTRITAGEANVQEAKSMHALRRIGQPEDVASAISWLLNPDQHWITGQVIGVNGGVRSDSERR